MSTAFTAPTAWTKRGQDLAGANELVLAYSQRRGVLGQAQVSPLTLGTSAQDKTLWLAMQNWLEANYGSFVNPASSPIISGAAGFGMHTLASWRAAAGLHADGFARYRNGALVGHGVMQAGDDRVALNFTELQNGFSALKWTDGGTVVNWTSKTEGNQRDVTGSGPYADRPAAKAAVQALWDASAPWAPNTTPQVQAVLDLAPPVFGTLLRRYAYPIIYLHALPWLAARPRAIEIYAYGTKITAGADWSEFNGNGEMTELGALNETIAETDAELWGFTTAVQVGGSNAPGNYPIWPGAAFVECGYQAHAQILLKWNFTNQN